MASKSKKVVVSVTNDLVTDQRVKRVCQTLHDSGFEIMLIGRKLRESLPLDDRPYRCKRVRLLFNKGPLFYAEFNFRLFFILCFVKADIFHANDLDTLAPNYLAAWLRRKKIVYDTHEYYTEVPELVHHPVKRKIWLSIEKMIFPKLTNVFTVNKSIADEYSTKYNCNIRVLRNVPQRQFVLSKAKRTDFNLPENKKILILQGAGINVDRGAEEAIMAMEFVEDAVLLIAGGGDVFNSLKILASKDIYRNKVIFIPKLPPERFRQLTALADAGLSLDKGTNLNYYFSLPNKLFDYIHAGIPVLCSPLPELKKTIDEFQVGCYIENHTPQEIAKKMRYILFEKSKLLWEKNLIIAAESLNWENEKHILTDVYEQFR